MRLHAELRVVAKRVKVVEVASSCRIEGRSVVEKRVRVVEVSSSCGPFFVIKEKQWVARAEVLDHNKARTCVSACF